MQSYLINIEISFINQLSKLHPNLINKLWREIDGIATQYGGTKVSPYRFKFPKFLNNSLDHIADAAWAIHTRLINNSRIRYGTTVCILPDNEEEIVNSVWSLIPSNSGNNGLWVDNRLQSSFTPYFEMSVKGKYLLVNSTKEKKLRLEEQLPSILIRQERLVVLTQALEKLDNSKGILIHGELGAGKRATLYEALRLLHTGSAIIESIPCSLLNDDLSVPFIRNLKNSLINIDEFLNGNDAEWWLNEGKNLLDVIRNGSIWNRSSDQDYVDIIKLFNLYYKGLTEYYKTKGKIIYLIIDGFNPDLEAAVPVMSALSNCMEIDGLRVIVICDSNDFTKNIPLPGNGIEVRFQNPSIAEWSRIVSGLTGKKSISKEYLKQLAAICGANLYRFFYTLLISKFGDLPEIPVEKAILQLLDNSTSETMFLACTAAGLVNKSLLIERFSSANDKVLEKKRYETLQAMGLLREDPDGLISLFSTKFYNFFPDKKKYASIVSGFGIYLMNKRKKGINIDIYQLTQYLKTWGNKESMAGIIGETIDVLLTKRRIQIAKKFLDDADFSVRNEKDRLLLNAAIEGGKLRLHLLQKTPQDLQWIVKMFQEQDNELLLNKASLAYVQGQWTSAFQVAKKSLSAYQRLGDHRGETFAHLELGLAQLALRRIRDAQDHFDIARRIGTQINAVWGVIRALSLKTITTFLYGNLSLAMKECLEHRELTRREGRRDAWMLLTLVAVRIEWELGQYRDAESYAKEGMKIAKIYNADAEKRVFEIWNGRSMLAQNKAEGRSVLESFTAASDKSAIREATVYLAEFAWFNKQFKEAQRLIKIAANESSHETRIRSEIEDWADGYSPIEGRMGFESNFMDVLGEKIKVMNLVFNTTKPNNQDKDKLIHINEQLEKLSYSSLAHEIAFCIALFFSKEENTQFQYYLRQAFISLQSRASRIDNKQVRHAWLNNNLWNKLLMEESRKMRLC